jgi:hypothetical protein
MRDYSCVPAEEWSNYESHQLSVSKKDFDDSADRDEVDEIYEAAADYKMAILINGGSDPFGGYNREGPEDIKLARNRLWKAVTWKTRLVLMALIEQGHLECGDYLIEIFW